MDLVAYVEEGLNNLWYIAPRPDFRLSVKGRVHTRTVWLRDIPVEERKRANTSTV